MQKFEMNEYNVSIVGFEVEGKKTPDFAEDTPMISYKLFLLLGSI